MVIIHNDAICRLVRSDYRLEEIWELRAFLFQQGTLRFTPLATGLFPAAGIDPEAAAKSGYGSVWVRDNIYVALAHAVAGDLETACGVVRALAGFFTKNDHRFRNIIEGRCDPNVPMNRPQVRFDGVTGLEIPSRWSHAQNDALGYFLWLYCRLAGMAVLEIDGDLAVMFARYFEVIGYWHDKDSGHWEEARKIEASSIGPVVAGLTQLRWLLLSNPGMASQCDGRGVTIGDLDRLIEKGNTVLTAILPHESIEVGPTQRRYDAALLFLIYPLDIVDVPMARRILQDVTEHLQGDHGIRRYLGDSYWTSDYKEKWPQDQLTADVSERQGERDILAKPGEEAQWCIFDPIVSAIYGQLFQRTADPADLERQIRYLNRSLGQITSEDCPYGALRCPEAYYLEHGRYVPNDHVPLLWTQANLWVALFAMEQSLMRR